MDFLAILVQASPPQSGWDMIFGGTLPTKLVLLVLSIASIASWVLIFWKQKQFKEVREAEGLFLEKIEQSVDLSDAYESILLLPDSPYGRVYRLGINFFNDLPTSVASYSNKVVTRKSKFKYPDFVQSNF